MLFIFRFFVSDEHKDISLDIVAIMETKFSRIWINNRTAGLGTKTKESRRDFFKKGSVSTLSL